MGSPDTDTVFAGSVPKLYDTYLVPLIFEPYAVDLVNRLGSMSLSRVLEVAAGTGVVTRALSAALPENVNIVATDLNQGMLDEASLVGTKRAVEWRQADAMQLPFPEATVVCQFGVMFIPGSRLTRSVRGHRSKQRSRPAMHRGLGKRPTSRRTLLVTGSGGARSMARSRHTFSPLRADIGINRLHPSSMLVALASPRIAATLDEGLDKIKRFQSEASAKGAEIVCFPEAYLPGLRGQDFEVFPFDESQQERSLKAVARWAREYAIATILGMERFSDKGRQIVAYVIDAEGQIQGYQTKNQLDPTEDQLYVPGNTRRLFAINGTKFGIVICHEGWRYPETVRWAAMRGAKIVFHPQHTGSEQDGVRLTDWGAPNGPYYEKAMMMRSRENTIYFASVNYALRFQESATSLIAPSGECQAYLPYGREGVLVQAINLEEATGLLATRYAPERYQDSV